MDRVHAGPEREREEGGTCSADEYYLVLLPPSIVTKGHDTCRLSRLEVAVQSRRGCAVPLLPPRCAAQRTGVPARARVCAGPTAVACTPAAPHPLADAQLHCPAVSRSTRPATDSAAPTALLTAAASLPCARRGLSATMFKNTFQSGFLSILYSIGACTLCFKTPRGRHLPQGTHTPPQSSRRPRQRTLAHPARLLASLSRPPVCANLPAARRLQAVADLGEGGAQWSHQAHHRQRHPVVRS